MSDKADLVYKLLQKLGLRYKVIKHPNMVTVKDMLEEPTFSSIKDDFVKNLFMSDSSKRYYLISALYDTEVNWKILRKTLKVNKLHMGDESEMEKLLGVSRGSLSPFCVINDTENKVNVLFDIRLKNKTQIISHPMTNDESVVMSMDDMLKFLSEMNHKPKFVALNDEDASKTVDFIDRSPREAESSKQVSGRKADMNILGITVKKEENFPEWYSQAIIRGEMIDYYDVSGCYILLPSSYYIWECFNQWLNKELKKRGVDNCYFPMFVTKDKLEVEKSHLEGFSPEVAWVTKYSDMDLQEPIAIRPTSETIMYPEFSRWIRSHRDLPLKLNQWNSVVRWEFKQPTPFIRSREILWQEGHTAHTTESEAMETMFDMLDLYKRFYEEYMAVPVIKGTKTENEKFPGGKMTTSVEAFITANGRGVQAGTSHLLGTNFAQMFDIKFEDEEGNKKPVHQTSWGVSTRSVGVMLMVHGDDKGLVIPPRVAKVQVVIVPIYGKNVDHELVENKVNELYKELVSAGFRTKLDDRKGYTPGFKYNHWELRGIPLRIEVGTKDLENSTCRLVRRDTSEKMDVSVEELSSRVSRILEDIQVNLLEVARKKLNESTVKAYNIEEVMEALNRDKLILAPWCGEPETEDEIKQETQKRSANNPGGRTGAMKSLCIPLEQPELPEGTKCFWTGKPAKKWVLWGRSY